MAEILILGRGAPQAKRLGAALNQLGWACKTERLDSPVEPTLNRLAPAVTVLIFRPGDQDQDQEEIGQWMEAPGQIIGWLQVRESEIDETTDQLRPITGSRKIAWFSANSPTRVIAQAVVKIVKSGRPSRVAASNAADQRHAMRLRAARDIATSLRELLPRLSFVREPVHRLAKSPAHILRSLELLLVRVRLLKLAQAHMASLESLAVEAGPSDWRLRQIVRVARTRLENAVASDEIALLKSLARGDEQAIGTLMQEPRIITLINLSEKSLTSSGIKLARARAAATSLMRKLLQIAASDVRKRETSSPDLASVVLRDAIARFWKLHGTRELKEVDRSQVRAVADDGDGEAKAPHRQPIAPEVINGENYYPVSWAARIVGVSPKTIHGWVTAGKVAVVDIRGKRHFDQAGLARLWALKEAAARARRRRDPKGKLLTVSQVILVTRAKDPREFERLRLKLRRATDALGITGARSSTGGRLYTLAEARRLRKAVGVDDDDA
jgi:hypothetical protein